MPTSPQISMALLTFSAEDQGSWQHTLARAKAADAAGSIASWSPITSSTARTSRPTDGLTRWRHWWKAADRARRSLARAAHRAVRARRHHHQVRLGTNILIAALRRPVVLAKTLSTLDVLSDGRVDLGVGVGWQREEYEAAGLEFEGRGRLLDHSLSVLQTLWSEQRASYKDDLLSFDAIHQMPKPRQAGGVPIWVSGTINPR